MTDRVVRRVRDLQVGDVTLSTGLIILSRPVRAINTPKGKHEVTVRRVANGVRGYRIWNSDTTIAVIPHPCFVDKGDPAWDLHLSLNNDSLT